MDGNEGSIGDADPTYLEIGEQPFQLQENEAYVTRI